MIHHYTSVSTLACILGGSKLRFSRFDTFDDVLEAQTHAGVNFGTQLFASCWVRHDQEDIAQWAMYGDRMSGVRISLPDDPFVWHRLDEEVKIPGTSATWTFDNVEAPFSIAEIFGNGYLLNPSLFKRETFGRDVEYVPDVSAVYREAVRKSGDVVIMAPPPIELARYKSSKWQFQKEYRFVLSARRGPACIVRDEQYGRALIERFTTPEMLKVGPLNTSIDLDLHPHALGAMMVTLGPLAEDAKGVIVSSLLRRYAPTASWQHSNLRGEIRPR